MAISAGDLVVLQGNASDGWDMKIISAEQGDILYYDGTDWSKLGHGTSGQFLKTGGHGANPAWENSNWTVFQNIVVSGEIKVPSGDTDYICPLIVSVPANYTCTLKNIRYRINGGTSVSFRLQKNGSDITNYGTSGSPLSCTGTRAETASDDTLADNDSLAPVVSAVSGTPKNMTIRVEFLLSKS